MTRRAAAAAVLALAALLAGCSGGDGLPAAGSGKGFIEGDGTVVQVAVADRGEPITFTGTAVDGSRIDLADTRGKVVVVNTWYAGCAPCREEAPGLQRVWSEYAARDVQFVGVNTRDTAGVAAAFQDRFGTTYPSVLDAGDGSAMLALRSVAPQATPTTVVLDAQGRVAAKASGTLDATTLAGMLDDAGAAPAPATPAPTSPAQPAPAPASPTGAPA